MDGRLGPDDDGGHDGAASTVSAPSTQSVPLLDFELVAHEDGGPRRRRPLPHRPAPRAGGLGQVSVAVDLELCREVALKELRIERADDPASRARFLREAQITGSLEHPGIVPVYGLGADELGRPYYAMRLIRGESLGQAIARFHDRHGPASAGRDRRARVMALRGLLRRFLDAAPRSTTPTAGA